MSTPLLPPVASSWTESAEAVTAPATGWSRLSPALFSMAALLVASNWLPSASMKVLGTV